MFRPYGDLSSLKEIKRKVKDENLRPTTTIMPTWLSDLVTKMLGSRSSDEAFTQRHLQQFAAHDRPFVVRYVYIDAPNNLKTKTSINIFVGPT